MLAMLRGGSSADTYQRVNQLFVAGTYHLIWLSHESHLIGQRPSLVHYFDCPLDYFIISIGSSRCQGPSQNRASSCHFASMTLSLKWSCFRFQRVLVPQGVGYQADGGAGGCTGDRLMSILGEIRDSLSCCSPPLASLPF